MNLLRIILVRSGYTAWRDKTPENTKAWLEAVDGYKVWTIY